MGQAPLTWPRQVMAFVDLPDSVIPQYPIYSATIQQFGGHRVGYYLDENNGWDLNLPELKRALKEARNKGTKVNSMVVINPGNPTGGIKETDSQRSYQVLCKTQACLVRR